MKHQLQMYIILICTVMIACSYTPTKGSTSIVSKEPTPTKTEVVVIGSIHGGHLKNQNYHPDTLRYLIQIANPDVLALEIREEDLSAKGYGQAPYEIKNIVIPWAKRNGIPFRPIDWWKDGGREKHNVYRAELEKTAEGKKKLSLEMDEGELHKDRFEYFDEMTVAYIHSDEYAEKTNLLQDNRRNIFGEGPGNLWWFTRAEKMNKLLGNIISEFNGKRIVVVSGAMHRWDFENSLRQREDVALVSVNSLPGVTNIPKYTGEDGEPDETELVLMLWVQGEKPNRSPDRIDTEKVKQLIKYCRAKNDKNESQPTVLIDFAEAEVHYLDRKYDMAINGFKHVSDIATDKDVTPLGGGLFKTLSKLRMANMLDLLDKREEALAIYNELTNDEKWAKFAEEYVKQPYERPNE